jgi:hypothetical protein
MELLLDHHCVTPFRCLTPSIGAGAAAARGAHMVPALVRLPRTTHTTQLSMLQLHTLNQMQASPARARAPRPWHAGVAGRARCCQCLNTTQGPA